MDLLLCIIRYLVPSKSPSLLCPGLTRQWDTGLYFTRCKESTLQSHDALSLRTQWDLRSPTLMMMMTSGDFEGSLVYRLTASRRPV